MTTNNITTVRQLLLDQMAALRAADSTRLHDEIDRAKGLAEVAQSITNVSKVELDYLRAVGGGNSQFLEDTTVQLTGKETPLPNGIQSITRHRLAG